MDGGDDILLHIPAEHFSALSEVILVGLQRAKLDSKTRKELTAWWEAENGFITDEIYNASKE